MLFILKKIIIYFVQSTILMLNCLNVLNYLTDYYYFVGLTYYVRS